jgi:hypothetical protein
MKINKCGFLGFLLICCACNNLANMIPKSTPEPHSAWIEQWLKKPTCNPPCWEGITPGQTSTEEAYHILSDLNYVRVEYNDVSSHKIRQTDWNIDDGTGYGMAIINNQTGIISDIMLAIKKDKLPLKEVYLIYGPPSYIVFERIGGELGYYCEIYIIYESLGLALKVGMSAKLKNNQIIVAISPDEYISELRFISPDVLSERLNKRKLYVVKWVGYGRYQIKY